MWQLSVDVNQAKVIATSIRIVEARDPDGEIVAFITPTGRRRDRLNAIVQDDEASLSACGNPHIVVSFDDAKCIAQQRNGTYVVSSNGKAIGILRRGTALEELAISKSSDHADSEGLSFTTDEVFDYLKSLERELERGVPLGHLSSRRITLG